MSLAQALALVASKKKSNSSKIPTASKRSFSQANTGYIEEALEQIESVANLNIPNLTIYGGDYHGNILGARIFPPTKPQRNGGSQFDSDSDVEEQPKARVTALAKALAREKGIDPSLLEKKHTQDRSINLRPIVSGELHAGSVGSIASYGRFVVTAGSQDENIRLSKRNADLNLNNLKEFGALHRHDSTPTVVTFTPSNLGQLCLTGGENGIIYIWSTLNRWDCIGVLRTHTTRIISIIAHPIVNMALSLSNDNKLVMWDLRPDQFKSLFITQLRQVKPQWGTQALVPLTMMFSPGGMYYSILYSRCVYTYHTHGANAGKIMSVVELPENSIALWSSVSYLDDSHIVLGNEKGDMYIHNVISTTLLSHLTGTHQYRVKSILPIPMEQSEWLNQYTSSLFPQPKKQEPKKVEKIGPNGKKLKTKDTPQDNVPTSSNIQRQFLVSADSDGKIAVWQIETLVTGSETIVIQPKSKTTQVVDSNLDDIDDAEDKSAESSTNIGPKFSYLLLAVVSEVKGKSICTLTTNTRITCLCLGLPFDPNNLNPLGNQYKSMGHVIETLGESRTKYEDETDRIYGRQQRDYARKVREQKEKDFKLKVRDYHRMKAGKIKDLAEGDAAKHGSSTSNSVIKGFGKEKFRKLDEEFQKDYERKKAEKEKGNSAKPVGTAKNGHMGRLDKKANPSLAGTLRARKRNGGKSKGPARGKKRF